MAHIIYMDLENFIPVTTIQGIPVDVYVSQNPNKRFIIWGAGHAGTLLARSFQRYGLLGKIFAFSDSLIRKSSNLTLGLSIISVEEALILCKGTDTILILTVPGQNGKLGKTCEDAGLTQGVDFIKHSVLRRQEIAIETVKPDPYLSFESATLGITPDSVEAMSYSTYVNVFEKLFAEIPNIYQIDFSCSPDPLFNIDLPKIIEHTERFAPTSVTTELSGALNFDEILSSHPTQFVVSINYWESAFIKRFDAYRWSTFRDRFMDFCEIQHKFAEYTHIRVKFNRFSNNQTPSDLESIKVICNQYGIKLVFADGYMNKYDDLLLRYSGTQKKSIDKHEIDKLSWDLDTAMKLSAMDKSLPCLCQRIFPVINHDSSLAVCHLYKLPKLHPSFLSISLNELIDIRHSSNQCRTCQSHALHRLDISILQQRHPDQLVASNHTP